jgi:hypothetical protein
MEVEKHQKLRAPGGFHQEMSVRGCFFEVGDSACRAISSRTWKIAGTSKPMIPVPLLI